MKKKIGEVTQEEKNELLFLFEKKNGLAELAKILGPDDSLYEKMVIETGRTSIEFQKWWDSMYEKYKWEIIENASWEIDFNTNEIFLE